MWTSPAGCVYLAVGSMFDLEESHYKELFEDTAKLLEEHPDCRKLAIDLRHNSGGYSTSFAYLQKHLPILKEFPFEQVFVLINGYTASNATRCITLLRRSWVPSRWASPPVSLHPFSCMVPV